MWSERFSSGQPASGAPGVCSFWVCPVGHAACAPKSVIIKSVKKAVSAGEGLGRLGVGNFSYVGLSDPRSLQELSWV